MTDINYKKVEQQLVEGLQRMGVDELLYIADLNAAMGRKKVQRKLTKQQQARLLTIQLRRIERDMKKIQSADSTALQKLGIDVGSFKSAVENPSKLTNEEWNTIKSIAAKIEKYKAEIKSKLKTLNDDELIEKARKEQKQARFNKRDKWLPLH